MTSLPSDRRRRPRISTMMLAQIRVAGDPPEVTRVRDLSECGLKIASKRPLRPGQNLKVRLPSMEGWVLARVAWAARGVAGVAFLSAVDLTALSNLRPALRIGFIEPKAREGTTAKISGEADGGEKAPAGMAARMR
jgi:hypothetical protein